MTAPVNDAPQMQSVPPKGAKVGVQPWRGARWMALIVDRLDERGEVWFRWPPSHPVAGNALTSFNIRSMQWSWKPAEECKFVKGCPKCHARGAHQVNGRETRCDRCDGWGLVPDHRPFD